MKTGKVLGIIVLTICLVVGMLSIWKIGRPAVESEASAPVEEIIKPVEENPLTISGMRKKNYPGSEITIESELPDGSNYHRFLASYLSDGLKIFALLTVPKAGPPAGGYPAIVFNHGYIPPEQYKPTEKYVAYVEAMASRGYVVFRPDYRGNGESEGRPEGAYYSPAYATDVLNALASIKKYDQVDPDKIGMWGHSMGGNITLRDMVVRPDEVKAAVIWAGVVGSYEDLMYNWQRKVPFKPSPKEMELRNRYRQMIMDTYGDPKANPQFWNSIDPVAFVSEIKTPVQLHHGTADPEVPLLFSENLYNKLTAAGKTVEFYTYTGADHNISGKSFSQAMTRTVEFFDSYLK